MSTPIVSSRRHVVVLAAGKGTRMESDLAKVLHEAAGRPLVSWVLDVAESVGPASITAVLGHQADRVSRVLPDHVRTVLQMPQNGTGHAAMLALEAIDPDDDDFVVVMPGDMPLVSEHTMTSLVAGHDADTDAVIVTTVVGDPQGYGRIVRGPNGEVRSIVEELDATDEQRAICEINTSIYSLRAGPLRTALAEVGSDNAQGEQYLTDVVAWLTERDAVVKAVLAPAEEGMGVNTRQQLDAVSAWLDRRLEPGSHRRSRPLR